MRNCNCSGTGGNTCSTNSNGMNDATHFAASSVNVVTGNSTKKYHITDLITFFLTSVCIIFQRINKKKIKTVIIIETRFIKQDFSMAFKEMCVFNPIYWFVLNVYSDFNNKKKYNSI